MKFKEAPFIWGPISKKQLKLLTWWHKETPVHTKNMIICDGAIRSGKSLPMSFSFVEWAFANFHDELFGITGKTIGSLRQNVINTLKKVLIARGYTVTERRFDKLLVVERGDRTNTFELFGGRDEGSQSLIQGRTLAGLFCDEVVLQPESFIMQAMARCSVTGSKMWFTCNPDGPYHWFKRNYIDRAERIGAYRLHFTLEDNLTLSQEIKDRFRKLYSGVFYSRYIMGNWTIAEGLIYDMWNPEDHVEVQEDFLRCIVAMDYGTNNPCTFGLYTWGKDDRVHLKKEYYYDSKKHKKQKTDKEYADDYLEWIGDVRPDAVYVDPSALSFMTELRSRSIPVIPANNSVLDGIRHVSSMLATGDFTVDPSCRETIKEFNSYIWDQKAVLAGEDRPVKKHDHAMDRNRYALLSHFNKPRVLI